jgi:hypothetical protein
MMELYHQNRYNLEYLLCILDIMLEKALPGKKIFSAGKKSLYIGIIDTYKPNEPK